MGRPVAAAGSRDDREARGRLSSSKPATSWNETGERISATEDTFPPAQKLRRVKDTEDTEDTKDVDGEEDRW
jgi:hypothetical protein